MRIPIIEVEPMKHDGVAFGFGIEWGTFLGVSVAFGWWRFSVGLRSIGV